MIKQLKSLHHQLLVWKMLHQKKSIFGNLIQETQGIEKSKIQDLKVGHIPSLAIVVISHNNQDIISKCLNSLIKFNSYNYEIVLVDNQSQDQTLKLVKTNYQDKIKIIQNSVNGCSSGRNLGASQTKAEYLVFLDSDQGPTQKDWLDEFLKVLVNFPKVGAVGWHGGFLTQSDLTGPALSHFPNRGIDPDYWIRTNIDYLESGGLMIKKTVFDQAGGFDTNYDPHAFEDTDLSRKLVQAKFDLAYCPALPIYHLAHSTTQADQNSSEYALQFTKNSAYFRRKWL